MSVPELIVAPVPASVDDTRTLLRELVTARKAGGGPGPTARTWAILGELTVAGDKPANERAVEHDRVGRQAVRLAVDKTLCVGDSRIVRALYQGAIMEGSWGDEARLVRDADEAWELLAADGDWSPHSADVVLLAAADPAVAALADRWPAAHGVTRTDG